MSGQTWRKRFAGATTRPLCGFGGPRDRVGPAAPWCFVNIPVASRRQPPPPQP
jgi:hypothetical protein